MHSGMHGFTGFFRFEEPNLVVIDVTPSSDVSEIGGCWAAQLSFSALLTYLWVG